MTMNPTYIPLFNQSQMDLDNSLFGLDGYGSVGSKWIGEVIDNNQNELAASVLVGPMTGDAPLDRKSWKGLELTGEGRAMVIIWVDNRMVAYGYLDMAGGPKHPNLLNIKKGIRKGYKCSAYISFRGKLLGCEFFYDMLTGGEQ